MRLPRGWLSEWVDLPDSAEDLEERLTMGGIEIEEVLHTGPNSGSIQLAPRPGWGTAGVSTRASRSPSWASTTATRFAWLAATRK